jgi:hypothetical protein
MAFTRRTNVNDKYRRFSTGRAFRPDPRMVTAGDMAALAANHEHRVAEAVAANGIERRHMVAVQKAMPYVRECRRKGVLPRRLPKKILQTIADLRLV